MPVEIPVIQYKGRLFVVGTVPVCDASGLLSKISKNRSTEFFTNIHVLILIALALID